MRHSTPTSHIEETAPAPRPMKQGGAWSRNLAPTTCARPLLTSAALIAFIFLVATANAWRSGGASEPPDQTLRTAPIAAPLK